MRHDVALTDGTRRRGWDTDHRTTPVAGRHHSMTLVSDVPTCSEQDCPEPLQLVVVVEVEEVEVEGLKGDDGIHLF